MPCTAAWINTASAMKLKYQFILYVVFLHALIAFFAYRYFLTQKYWFIAVEALLILSLFFAFRIYRHLIRPLDLLSSGIQSLKDQDYSINYREIGSPELDELIRVFNTLRDQLRQERTIQQEQHYFLEKLMDAAPVGIIILDGNDRIRQVNRAASRILACLPEVLTGKSCHEINSPFAEYLTDLSENYPKTIRMNGIRNYRITKSYFINLGFRNSFILLDEITNEMLAVEKEAFGKVIRMMSHEVNNSIGATNSILQTLKSFCDSLLWR
jgi:nitrogen fixation/metabolism regulation signal transduction histidine kinase